VTIAGMHGERPPTELDAFGAYAAGLALPGIARIARECEPLGDALVYRFPSSRWRHWEKLDRRPAGFVVLGDAVCSFNPVYGQGMSAAAQQARALGVLLDERPDVGDVELPRRAAAAFAAVVAVPWALATGGDRRYPGMPRKPLPERVLDRYLDRLLRVARRDPTVCLAFARVLNLLAAPPSLLAPDIAVRVLRPGAARAGLGTRVSADPKSVERIPSS
jgi:2-polyprenyl-6-methoxyphenol hydroxylase-like FAD-dependent oxidoreductase